MPDYEYVNVAGLWIESPAAPYAMSSLSWFLVLIWCSSMANSQTEGEESTPHECTLRPTVYGQIVCLGNLLVKGVRDLSDVPSTMCQAEDLLEVNCGDDSRLAVLVQMVARGIGSKAFLVAKGPDSATKIGQAIGSCANNVRCNNGCAQGVIMAFIVNATKNLEIPSSQVDDALAQACAKCV
eukprot:7964173-Pyramimonas_sp.AAC.3